MARAARVNQQRGAGEFLQVQARGSRVIQVHVGGDNVADLLVRYAQVIEGTAQVAEAVVGAGLDQGVLAGVADEVEAGGAGLDVVGVDAGDASRQGVERGGVWRAG